MCGEAVQDRLEVLDGAQVELHEVAVFAGDPVALGDFGCLPRDLGDGVHVSAQRADPHDGRDRIAEGTRIHLRAEGEDGTVFEPPHPFGDRRRGEPDPAAEFRDPQPGVRLQLLNDAQIEGVERFEGLPGNVPSF
jgi:hypothetical protein